MLSVAVCVAGRRTAAVSNSRTHLLGEQAGPLPEVSLC